MLRSPRVQQAERECARALEPELFRLELDRPAWRPLIGRALARAARNNQQPDRADHRDNR
jgi:hypothetical protein